MIRYRFSVRTLLFGLNRNQRNLPMVRTKPPMVPPPRGSLEATYDYRDEHGNLLYQVLRYLPKRFHTQRPTKSGGWSANVKRVRRVPYRLPELLAASSGEPVFIVE